jgi:hypothetical protein
MLYLEAFRQVLVYLTPGRSIRQAQIVKFLKYFTKRTLCECMVNSSLNLSQTKGNLKHEILKLKKQVYSQTCNII